MTTRHCDDCGHTGDEGGSTTESYCGAEVEAAKREAAENFIRAREWAERCGGDGKAKEDTQ